MGRRRSLKKSTIAAGSITAGKVLGRASEIAADELEGDYYSKNPARLRQRNYGQTGVKLSIIGFGGIVVMDAEQHHANRVVAEAFEKGVNYFDVSPTYGDAELKLGPALEPYRKKVFLACKTGQRRREGAAKELKESLKRLRTDYLDLYQLHSITDVKNDVDAVFGFSKQKNRGGFVILVFPPILSRQLSLPWIGTILILSCCPLISPHSIKAISAPR